MNSRNCISSLFAVLVAVTLAYGDTVVHSDQAVLLSDLLTAGQTISVGDKTFGDFAYSKVGDMPDATVIDVIPIVVDGDYGVRFQGPFIDLVGGGSSDSLITFSVEAPAPLIEGARLYGNLGATGNGIASITETFLPTLPSTAMTITAGLNLEESVTFAPLQKLMVQKDILLFADDAPATLSLVDQAFPQVPEPASSMLCAFALAGLFAFCRRVER